MYKDTISDLYSSLCKHQVVSITFCGFNLLRASCSLNEKKMAEVKKEPEEEMMNLEEVQQVFIKQEVDPKFEEEAEQDPDEVNCWKMEPEVLHNDVDSWSVNVKEEIQCDERLCKEEGKMKFEESIEHFNRVPEVEVLYSDGSDEILDNDKLCVQNAKGAYSSDNCNNIINTETLLSNYERIKKKNILPDNLLSCHFCKKSFDLEVDFETHMRLHNSRHPFSCGLCGKAFRFNSNYIAHMRTHTGDRPYPCSLCIKSFTSRGDLNKHMRTHTGELPYPCEVCKRCFSHKSNLNKHMRNHTGDLPFPCEVCGKAFSFRSDLRKHMTKHTGDFPFSCEFCPKSFSQKGHLNRHLRVHAGERPFGCEICGKAFTDKCNLHSHIRIHTRELPFPCDICNKYFSQKGHVNRHKRVVHHLV